jgi:hypothetical protein
MLALKQTPSCQKQIRMTEATVLSKTSMVSSEDEDGAGSQTSGDNNSSQSSTNGALRNLGHKENKAVNVSKILMVLIILGATAIFSVMTYKYVKSQEKKEFEVRVR